MATFHENPNLFNTKACRIPQHHQQMANMIRNLNFFNGDVANGLN